MHINKVRSIMHAFAVGTGLTDTLRTPRRYLWTDAFAVCNFLELHRQTGNASLLNTARRLVEQVHFVLGRFSVKDSRSGWISGLAEQAGYEHPTIGGLRIGKNLLERRPGEPFDERLEWERDGQYFHYLTKWMQALTRIAIATGDARYQRWAMELASSAHAGFTYRHAASGLKLMHWKMSVDLTRALVPGMGHHDPLDGLLTYLELMASRKRFGDGAGDIDLTRQIADFHAMCAGQTWASDDPLGTGNLLGDTLRLAQLRVLSSAPAALDLVSMLADAQTGLAAFAASGMLGFAAERRLAFRELGLATGLRALDKLRELMDRHPDKFSKIECTQLASLARFGPLGDQILQFWLQAAHQQAQSWQSHPDINAVMLATSLAPDSYLLLDSGEGATLLRYGGLS